MSRKSQLLASIACAGLLASQAVAQEGETEQTEAQAEGETDVVRVVGFRSSLASSLEAKRNADQVIDSITSEDIGQFADQNIAEAIARISGVQIQRLNGEGSTVSVRGLSPLFTRVEIDGRTGVGGGADPSRETQLQFYNSDLFQTITVVKSPTAADVEGGLGGIVRLETPDPLDLGERSIALSAQMTDADQRDDQEPTYQGLYSDVFMDERLGVLVSASYLERDAGLDQIQNNRNWLIVGDDVDLADDADPALLALVGGRVPGRLRQEQESGDRERVNVNAKIQFMATPELELFLDGLYSQEDETIQRNRIQVQFSRGDLESGTLDASTGTLTEATFTGQRSEFRHFVRGQDNLTWGLNGGFDWTSGPWSLFGEASYQYNEVALEETRATHRTNSDDLGGYSIVDDPQYPILFTAATELDRADIDIRDLDLEDRVIESDDWVVRLDAEREVDLGLVTSFEFGARYASSTSSRRQQIANSVIEDEGGTYADGPELVRNDPFAAGFGPDGFLRAWPTLDPLALFNANDIAEVVDSQRRFEITEENIAFYGMANFEAEPGGWFARGNAGVRWTSTPYSGDGRIFITEADGTSIQSDDAPDLDADYNYFLPSFNLVLSPSEESDLQFRGAITRALTRPEFNQISPVRSIDLEDQDGSFGNPDLDPFLAWQYDLGVEYYFADDAAITLGFFYKDIEDFIFESAGVQRVVIPEFGIDDDLFISTVENGGDAQVQGFEFSVQAPFSFLPAPFNGAGLAANYTYTDSEFTNEDGFTQPFPGSSENAYNLIGYYEQGGFSTRLAYNFRDEFVLVPAQTDGGTANQEINEEQGRLDLAVRYRFENGVNLAFDALNLTEEQNFIFYDTPDRLENIEVEGRINQFRIGYTY